MRWLLASLALLAQPASAETVAIVGAKVWTGAAVPVENATVVITDGRIVSLASNAGPQTADRTIDARTMVVTLPIDAAATQIGLVEVSAAGDTDDRAVSAGPLGAAFDASLALDPASLTIQQARADGVGHAMSFPGPSGAGIFAGQGARIDLGRGDLADSPRAAVFVSIGGSAADSAGGSRAGTWGQLRGALDDACAKGGGTLGKADLAALQRVIRREIPLAIMANRESDSRQAIALSRDYGIRVVIVGGAESWRAAPELAAAGIPVILDPLDDLPVTFDSIGARRDNAARLARAGVTIAFSVSAQGIYLNYNVGPGVREGAGVAVANGLPYAAGVQAITAGAARIWGGAVPVLAAGAEANLVIWDGDPLEPSSAPVAVFLHGREIGLATRQTLLRDRYRP